jgi:hypothetical protein
VHHSLFNDIIKKHPRTGHNFAFKNFEYEMRCALCEEYNPASRSLAQCTICKIVCHETCFSPVRFSFVPSCLYTDTTSSTSSTSTSLSMKEAKWRYSLRAKAQFQSHHQWEPLFNLSANWCSHCGFFLSLGPGNHEGANRRYKKCGITCHAQCEPLVSSKCGFKPDANRPNFFAYRIYKP